MCRGRSGRITRRVSGGGSPAIARHALWKIVLGAGTGSSINSYISSLLSSSISTTSCMLKIESQLSQNLIDSDGGMSEPTVLPSVQCSSDIKFIEEYVGLRNLFPQWGQAEIRLPLTLVIESPAAREFG